MPLLTESTKAAQPSLRGLHSPWLMWSITVLFVLFQFFLQLCAGVMVGQLMRSFNLTALGAGMLAGSFYFIYTLLQTPAGMLVDRLGPRRLLAGGGLICALGCLIFATSGNAALAFVGRLLTGAGSSFAFVSSLYLVAEWFPAQRFGMMVGLAETMGMLGTLIGNVFLSSLLQHTPWRDAMSCYVIVRDKPENTLPISTPNSASEFLKDLRWILRNTGLWMNGLFTGLVFSSVTVFAAFWGLPYLMLAQKVSLPIATTEASLIFIGMGISSPMMGWLYPRIGNKNLLLSLCALCMSALAILLIYFIPSQIWAVSLSFLLLGVLCSSYVFNYTLANHIVPKRIRSTSIGFTNTLCVITAPLLQPLIGWVLNYTAHTTAHSFTGTYTLTSYHIALSIIPLSLMLAAGIAWFIPTNTSPK